MMKMNVEIVVSSLMKYRVREGERERERSQLLCMQSNYCKRLLFARICIQSRRYGFDEFVQEILWNAQNPEEQKER